MISGIQKWGNPLPVTIAFVGLDYNGSTMKKKFAHFIKNIIVYYSYPLAMLAVDNPTLLI